MDLTTAQSMSDYSTVMLRPKRNARISSTTPPAPSCSPSEFLSVIAKLVFQRAFLTRSPRLVTVSRTALGAVAPQTTIRALHYFTTLSHYPLLLSPTQILSKKNPHSWWGFNFADPLMRALRCCWLLSVCQTQLPLRPPQSA